MTAHSILADAPSTLSANSITVDITDASQLEVTFTSRDGENSWGEALSYEDTLYVAERLAYWWAETTGPRRA